MLQLMIQITTLVKGSPYNRDPQNIEAIRRYEQAKDSVVHTVIIVAVLIYATSKIYQV